MSDGLTSLLSYGVQSLVILKNMVGWRREEKKNHLEMTGNASDCKCFTEKRLFPTSKHLFGSQRTNMDPLMFSFLTPHQRHAGVWSQQPLGERQEYQSITGHTHTLTHLQNAWEFSVELMCVFGLWEETGANTHRKTWTWTQNLFMKAMLLYFWVSSIKDKKQIKYKTKYEYKSGGWEREAAFKSGLKWNLSDQITSHCSEF